MKPGEQVIVPSLGYPHRAIVVAIYEGIHGQRADVSITELGWEGGPDVASWVWNYPIELVKPYAPE